MTGYHDRAYRDWHTGVRLAQRVLERTTMRQIERIWDYARRHITSPEDHFGLGYVGCLASALDEYAEAGRL